MFLTEATASDGVLYIVLLLLDPIIIKFDLKLVYDLTEVNNSSVSGLFDVKPFIIRPLK